jgi:transcriptional regulator with XRE-family HTH domain
MPSSVDFAAQWLRSERELVGWSTTELARRARVLAAESGDPIKLTQQSISHFENRRAKSIPRWMRYVRTAIAVEASRRELNASSVWSLRLKGDDEPEDNGLLDWLPTHELDDEESRLIEKWRQLTPKDRKALLQILDTMVSPGTVHTPRVAYRADDEGKERVGR